jgi:ABC-2 type transport system ATP-binding protein
LAAATSDSPSAAVTTSAPAANASSGLTVAPVTTYFDGVLQGNLNVNSAKGCGQLGNDCTLSYSLEGTSAGGKATFGNVPTALPGGGAGSYTLIPYATWIDPANPTKFPTPSGTQDFTVRVSENTMFDQAITGIPLVGIIAQPIINLLQQTPFIGNLLAPLIGSSINQTISVNLNQLVPAGKQVAYTYRVTSFDGTLISTNFFPAATPSLPWKQ